MIGEIRMSTFQSALWDFLSTNYIGPEHAAPRAAILARFSLLHERFTTDDRHFRIAVAELVTYFQKPICTSSSGGYFVARTTGELAVSIRDLKARGSACFERARALEAAIPLERQERLL